MAWLPGGETIEDICIPFDRIHERDRYPDRQTDRRTTDRRTDRQTDGRTDGRTPHDGIGRAYA